MKFDLSQRKSWFRQAIPIAIVLVVSIALGGYILAKKAPSAGDEPGHNDKSGAQGVGAGGHADEAHHKTEADAPRKGPHGGRLFVADDHSLELTIFETGVEPQFRVYFYRDDKPIDPTQNKVVVTLERLGRKPHAIAFTKEADYLKGNEAIAEPHSFSVTIAAEIAGKTHQFKFDQVEARVAMTDEQLKSNGVQIATVGPARIKTALQLQGEVRLNDDRTVHVVPRLTGLVESVSAHAGDKVRRGQLLAVVSSQSLADQRSEWLAAQKRVVMARTTFERETTLWEGKISAEQDYLQARHALQETEIAEQAARQKLASLGVSTTVSGKLTRYEIRSPIDGVVTDKNISVGEVIKDDANIFIVADLSTVWIEMTVYAKDVNAIQPGQQAIVKATSFEAQAAGKLVYVGALVGEQTRAAKARLVLPNPKGLWRPGLPVNVELIAEDVEVSLAISADAVQTLRESSVVFGRYGDQFEARAITLGRSDGKMIEILGGLEPGERYAARNSYLLKADIGKSGASHDH